MFTPEKDVEDSEKNKLNCSASQRRKLAQPKIKDNKLFKKMHLHMIA